MIILPAIDLYNGKAVRLYKGNYSEITVYNDNPLSVAEDFEKSGAKYIHIVDLEGARDGNTPNMETVRKIVENTSLSAEIGGGIRSMEIVEKYISVGVKRVILGTAAVTDDVFLTEAVKKYPEQIAVGADIKNGFVAIKGWCESSGFSCNDFFAKMQNMGVKTVICTDISKDGAMKGTNIELYKELSEKFSMQIIASGGVSSISDIKALKKMNIYGAIIGKAYYTGAIKINEAIEAAK